MNRSITRLRALEILDSRGRPTLEVKMELANGVVATASVPSGSSTGRHEAVERRDGDPARYGGYGVLGAARAVEEIIAPALRGVAPEPARVDEILLDLDGTPQKSGLGANAILAVSAATTRAAALDAAVPLYRYIAGGGPVSLPMPMVNIVSGGLHAARQLDFQDFLVIPVGATSFAQALEMVCAVYHSTAAVLSARGLVTLRALEGGFGPELASHETALEVLTEAVEAAGLAPGDDVRFALDVAATHFHDGDRYVLTAEHRTVPAAELAELLAELARRFPIVSIEDPFAEDDWEAWRAFTAEHGAQLQIVADDLFATNLGRVERGIAEGAANAVLVKMSQAGSITETLQVVERAKRAGLRTVVSARSGETEDDFLADLAVGTDAGQIKVGSITGSERLAKYNRLLRIERELGDDGTFARWQGT